MRVAITGGVGFVGSAIARLLPRRGIETHVIVRPGTDPSCLDRLPPVAVHAADLANLEETARVIETCRPDVVVHAAASHGHPVTPDDRLRAWRDDVIATASLLEALRPSPPRRLVHVCSSLVYRPSPEPLDEQAPLGPETHRGVTKLAAAAAVQQWSVETGAASVVVRPFSIYGRGEDPARVIPTLLRALRTDTPFAVTSEDSRRDFVHIDDVVRCIELLLDTTSADDRVLNVGTGVETSIPELVSLAERVTGRRVVSAPNHHPPTPPERSHWYADPSLAAALVGWKAELDLEEGFRILWGAGHE